MHNKLDIPLRKRLSLAIVPRHNDNHNRSGPMDPARDLLHQIRRKLTPQPQGRLANERNANSLLTYRHEANRLYYGGSLWGGGLQ